jgi:hypothetical protein
MIAAMGAADPLFEREVYKQLRALARSYFRAQRVGHTLSPTGLVHEAYLRLSKQPGEWKDRGHFMAVAATAMRQILINHARDAATAKRGGGGRERVHRARLGGVSAPLTVPELSRYSTRRTISPASPRSAAPAGGRGPCNRAQRTQPGACRVAIARPRPRRRSPRRM